MTAPLARIATTACGLYRCAEADLRLGWDERALAALGAFGWLAQRAGHPAEATAAYAARPLSMLLEYRAAFAAQIEPSPDHLADFEVEIAALVAAAAIDRQRGRLVDDVDPAVIARRLIVAGPGAVTIGAGQLRALAAAYLALRTPDQPLTETAHV